MSVEYDPLDHSEQNSWSKYQLLVLQQLEDHNKLLQNLNREVVASKQAFAVQEAQLIMWKAQITSDIEKIQEALDSILHDEKGLAQRVSVVERSFDIEEKSNTKIKATWALYGSIAMVVINLIVQAVGIYLKK